MGEEEKGSRERELFFNQDRRMQRRRETDDDTSEEMRFASYLTPILFFPPSVNSPRESALFLGEVGAGGWVEGGGETRCALFPSRR